VVNGTPVPVRTELIFNFTNTLDRYRAPNGDVPVHLDEKASNGLLTKKVEPEYPYEAKLKRIEGAVKLRAIVGEDGRVHALHIISGPPLLAQEAYNAVRQWVFKPCVEKGKTLPIDTNVTIFFKMR
jgi:TonB family protein